MYRAQGPLVCATALQYFCHACHNLLTPNAQDPDPVCQSCMLSSTGPCFLPCTARNVCELPLPFFWQLCSKLGIQQHKMSDVPTRGGLHAESRRSSTGGCSDHSLVWQPQRATEPDAKRCGPRCYFHRRSHAKSAGTPLLCIDLKHLHSVETRFYCPQAFLSLDFQCRDDVFELK